MPFISNSAINNGTKYDKLDMSVINSDPQHLCHTIISMHKL